MKKPTSEFQLIIAFIFHFSQPKIKFLFIFCTIVCDSSLPFSICGLFPARCQAETKYANTCENNEVNFPLRLARFELYIILYII